MSSPGRKMYKRISQRSDPKEPPPALSPLKAKRQRDIKALSPKRSEKGDSTKTKQDRKPRGDIKKNLRDLKTTTGNLKSIDLALPPRSPVAFISWNRGRGDGRVHWWGAAGRPGGIRCCRTDRRRGGRRCVSQCGGGRGGRVHERMAGGTAVGTNWLPNDQPDRRKHGPGAGTHATVGGGGPSGGAGRSWRDGMYTRPQRRKSWGVYWRACGMLDGRMGGRADGRGAYVESCGRVIGATAARTSRYGGRLAG